MQEEHRLSFSGGQVVEAKIARLRAEIQSGQYSPDLKVVAERIIGEAVQFSGQK